MTDVSTTAARTPLDIVPSASSPHLLTHLLEMVARGIRSTRGLEEALGVDPRTLRYYLHAARWLGLLSPRPEPVLSSEGLAYVYAGEQRHEVYARVVRNQPFLSDLLARCGPHVPDTGTIAHAVRRADPGLASTTVERRASAIRSLLTPAFEPGGPPSEDHGQLTLPLAQVPHVAPTPPVHEGPGRAFHPDLYRFILCTLLDHGELTLGHLRALLDHAGADDVPLGAYVELALARGDALRRDDRLVVTPAATRRRDLATSTASVILSDSGWREVLDALRSGRDQPGRYRLWFRRLLGREGDLADVDREIARVLQDRSLAAFPIARREPTPEPPQVARPFLEVWATSGLVLALPSSLVQVWEGVRGIDRRLRNARTRADAVGLPTVAYRPSRVHGGLLHPGETLPRAIGDAGSLRRRAVSRAPYFALVAAVLLAARTGSQPPRVRRKDGTWHLLRGRSDHGTLLEVLDAFAVFRGWHTSRVATAGIDDDVLASLMERLGVAVGAQDHLLLDDGFFAELRSPEGQALAPLQDLAASFEAWLDRLEAGVAA